CQKYSWPPHTF
nr:immunoglobulin light chain junction region [Macaca mulatta]